jgi:uncharacterized protein (DUF488 family)
VNSQYALREETCRFFTIGHSTRSIDEFVRLVKAHNVNLVVDVRTVPRSRANPQYDSQNLTEVLAQHGIDYVHIAALGGLRGKARDVSPEANKFWTNQSFHNYADYALSKEFRAALLILRRLGHARTCAIMCAEAVWWRCHRRIIADYLLASGETVSHILATKRTVTASLTTSATIKKDGRVLYPAAGATTEGRGRKTGEKDHAA